MIFLLVLHTMTNNFDEDSSIARDYINVNVGKRVRMECELNNYIMNGNKKVNSFNDLLIFLFFLRVYGYV